MSQGQGVIIGIDLGTTNSVAAVVRDGRPVIIPVDGQPLLPSVVGLAPDDSLLVGYPARNQYVLHPERTVRSIKRRMGEDVQVEMGARRHTPVEVSAIILRRLKQAAEGHLGEAVERAVVTVPAYFSDAQRTATREAGEVAGFVVERILNEPTAAALCYLSEADEAATRDRLLMVYDLGGGTFDVSILRSRGEVTEVLASHGDSHLGGDDFDAELLARLAQRFEGTYGVALNGNLRATARLTRAAEDAKIRLSRESYVRVAEEHLVERDGVGLHLDEEVARHEYEALIERYLARTRDSVQTALREAKLLARQIDDVLLVGGSTRTPRVGEMLHDLLGRAPRMDVDPDTAVALGAALQAARIAGDRRSRILVDVTPFSFGTSYLGLHDGVPSQHCYKVVIRRNTPLPTRQTEVFYTLCEGQRVADVHVYQGEEADARHNLEIGQFKVDGLDPEAPGHSPILFDLKLDLDGILEVEVTEKHTGLKKRVTIADAFRKLSASDLAAARARVRAAFGEDEDGDEGEGDAEWDGPDGEDLGIGAGNDDVEAARAGAPALPPAPEGLSAEDRAAWSTARSLCEKAERMRARLGRTDAAEVEEIATRLATALAALDFGTIKTVSAELADVLFYLE